MRKVLLVVGLKEIPGRPTKFKLAVISPTNVGKVPTSIFFQKCEELHDSASVYGAISKAKAHLEKEYSGSELEIVNGLYVSQTGGVLKETSPVSGELLNRIMREIEVPDMA